MRREPRASASGRWCVDRLRERIVARHRRTRRRSARCALLRALARRRHARARRARLGSRARHRHSAPDRDFRFPRRRRRRLRRAAGACAVVAVAAPRPALAVAGRAGRRRARDRSCSTASLAGGSLPTVRTLLMIAVVALARCCGRRAERRPHALALALLAMLLRSIRWRCCRAGFWLSLRRRRLPDAVPAAAGRAGVARLPARAQRRPARDDGVAAAADGVVLRRRLRWSAPLSNLIARAADQLRGRAAVPARHRLRLLGVPALATPVLARGRLDARTRCGGCSSAMADLARRALVSARAAPWALLRWRRSARSGCCCRAACRHARSALLLFLPLLWPDRAVPARRRVRGRRARRRPGTVGARAHARARAAVTTPGARYPSGFRPRRGRGACRPCTRSGVRRLDTLMISHGDNDHAGGAAPSPRPIPLRRRFGGEPARVAAADRRSAATDESGTGTAWTSACCIRRAHVGRTRVGQRPLLRAARRGAGRARLLLTGDISSRVEAAVAAAAGAGAAAGAAGAAPRQPEFVERGIPRRAAADARARFGRLAQPLRPSASAGRRALRRRWRRRC